MFSKRKSVSSGINHLDQLLGGLYIGDNVILYDDAGSLASAFSMNFIKESQINNKPIIYVSFDRSPRNLLEKLGPLAESQHLTILDCFTNGKGDGSYIFNKFYEKNGAQWPYQIIKVNEPWKPDLVADSIYSLHKTMKGDVRFVFESLTGMQDLWEGEEHILKFYSHSCPRLYELETIAYWIIEKEAHSSRLKAHINQIAQVAIDLSIKRGKSTLTIIKADKRNPDTLNKPCSFWSEGTAVNFDSDLFASDRIDLGSRIKNLRIKQGLSQKDLAKLIGVTPSTISQVESNSIYPSLPALFKIAETLSVDTGSFFQNRSSIKNKTIFRNGSGININFADMPKDSIKGESLVPMDLNIKAEPYIIEIMPKKSLPSHFFIHKGEEIGFVLSGKIQAVIQNETHEIKAGDMICLTTEIPSQWKNPGPDAVRMLWVKMK